MVSRMLGVLYSVVMLATWLGAASLPAGPSRLAWFLAGFGWLGAALAWGASRPDLLGKTPQGHLPLSRAPFLWSWWLARYVLYELERLSTGESPHDEVVEGVWIGRWLIRGELRAMDPAGWAVLDLTAELPATFRGEVYRSVPVLEHTPPTLDQLDQVNAFLTEQRAAGRRVYVHCAMGHTRSATAVVAWWLTQRPELSPDQAIAELQRARPRTGIGSAHRATLSDWRKRLAPSQAQRPLQDTP